MRTLADIVTVERRFARSARLDADLGGTPPLTGYVLQGSVQKSLLAMMAGIAEGGQTAFTWTGPYGGGKSSAALLLASLVGGTDEQRKLAAKIAGKDMTTHVRAAFPETGKGWRVVALTGRRADLRADLAEGCAGILRWNKTVRETTIGDRRLNLGIRRVLQAPGDRDELLLDGRRYVQHSRAWAFILPKAVEAVDVGLNVGVEFGPPVWKDVDRLVIEGGQERVRALIGGAGEHDLVAGRVADNADLVVVHAPFAQSDLNLETPMRDQPRQRVEAILEQLVASALDMREHFRTEPIRDLAQPVSFLYGFNVVLIGERPQNQPYLSSMFDEGGQCLGRVADGGGGEITDGAVVAIGDRKRRQVEILEDVVEVRLVDPSILEIAQHQNEMFEISGSPSSILR